MSSTGPPWESGGPSHPMSASWTRQSGERASARRAGFNGVVPLLRFCFGGRPLQTEPGKQGSSLPQWVHFFRRLAFLFQPCWRHCQLEQSRISVREATLAGLHGVQPLGLRLQGPQRDGCLLRHREGHQREGLRPHHQRGHDQDLRQGPSTPPVVFGQKW